MTNKLEWKIAKWLKRHGETKRSNVPKWFPDRLSGGYKLFHVKTAKTDAEGYPCISPDDLFTMTDKNLDAFESENVLKVQELREWIAIAISVSALIISIIALIY